MSHLQQLPALLRQQADGLGVVLDGLLKDQMLLQQLQCAWLVLVGKRDDKQRCFNVYVSIIIREKKKKKKTQFCPDKSRSRTIIAQ